MRSHSELAGLALTVAVCAHRPSVACDHVYARPHVGCELRARRDARASVFARDPLQDEHGRSTVLYLSGSGTGKSLGPIKCYTFHGLDAFTKLEQNTIHARTRSLHS